MSPFFGLTLNYRKQLHAHIFDLIFHGNGGFTHTDVYNMPVWARRFYITKIIEFKREEQAQYDKQMKKARAKR